MTMQQHRLSDLQRDQALQHFIDGAALDAKGAFAEAILEYQEALQNDPNASIYYAISRDYLLLNKFDRAVETASEAVRLEPQNITYHENLGTAYFNASHTDLAIQEYEDIIKLDSSYTSAWLTLAHLYQPIQPQKALEIYEKMLERNGEQLDILFQCAQLYAVLGRYDEAAAKFQMMLELDPTNKSLKKQLAEILAKSGKLDRARSILEEMVEADSSDIEVVATLADVYLDQKQFQNAINLYEQLYDRGIKNTEIKLRIGVGFFGLTEHDSTLIQKAQGIFQELHTEVPNDWRPCWYWEHLQRTGTWTPLPVSISSKSRGWRNITRTHGGFSALRCSTRGNMINCWKKCSMHRKSFRMISVSICCKDSH